MTLDDIADPLLRDAAARLVAESGKPLQMWIVGQDEAMLRRLLVRRRFLIEEGADRPPFDPDEFAIRMALRHLSVKQRKGLAYGDVAFIETAADEIVKYFRMSGIKLQHCTGHPADRS